MASIVVVSGPSRGNYLRLESRVVSVGRDEHCDMQVLDQRVSRRHLEIAPGPAGSGYVARDRSTNGVFVNAERLDGTVSLHDGDVIVIGESKLVFTEKDLHDQQAALTFAAHGQQEVRTIGPGDRAL